MKPRTIFIRGLFVGALAVTGSWELSASNGLFDEVVSCFVIVCALTAIFLGLMITNE